MASRVSVGDRVRIKKGSLVYEGVVLPKSEFSSDKILVIKLDNGYNIGVDVSDAEIEVLSEGVVRFHEPGLSSSIVKGDGNLKLTFLSTGGTIVSKVDYETGAVRPAITATELLEAVPEFIDYASELVVVEYTRLFSEDLTPAYWAELSSEVGKIIESGAEGVLIAHGTDTMTYTASALAFALRNLPIPVVLVGSQRSSDRPSSDSALNMKASLAIFKEAPFGEVVMCMHGTISDNYVLAHRGVKVRKMHSSRRDAFQSINDVPLARIDFPDMKFRLLNQRFIAKSKREDFRVLSRFSDKVALLKFYPGMDCEIIDFFVDREYGAIVIEGTGLGHVRNACVDSIARATEEGVITVITTQTIFGRVNMNVYSTGRRLLKAGAIPGHDILSEVAYVKLSWILGNYPGLDKREYVELFHKNLAYEYNPVHKDSLFPVWSHEY
ncbi:MAG: Glu-tRNA(Gln) amidotransferase subunit GatD [Desulfurococcaceae archaeon TW002]